MGKEKNTFSELALKTLRHYKAMYKFYPDILQELDKRINAVVDIRPVAGKRRNPCGYVINETDTKNHLYSSLRIADHLPMLRNYIEMNPKVPSDNEHAHMCMMFLGYDVWNTLGSMKGNINMGKDKEKTKVALSHAAYSYYKDQLPLEIPYHIYHFIPEFIVESDLNALGDAVNQWLTGRGENEFVVPTGLSQDVYYKKHRQSGIASIDCMMHIEAAPEPVNEVRATGGKRPLMSIDMGRVTVVSPDGEEMTIRGTLDVWSADDRSIDMLNLFRERPVSSKRRYESLDAEKQRILESIMPDVERIIDERLGTTV